MDEQINMKEMQHLSFRYIDSLRDEECCREGDSDEEMKRKKDDV